MMARGGKERYSRLIFGFNDDIISTHKAVLVAKKSSA